MYLLRVLLVLVSIRNQFLNLLFIPIIRTLYWRE